MLRYQSKSLQRALCPAPPILTACSNPRCQRLQYIAWRNFCSTRRVSSEEGQMPNMRPLQSMFSQSQSSTWDHVFKGIADKPPVVSQSGPRRGRRQAMTNREISAFNDMFNMIFDAVSEQSRKQRDVDLQRDDLGGLFSKLRRHSKKIKWTTEEENLLDQKKEEMDMCDTDQQLLDWAMREVFEDSVRREAASRLAMENPEIKEVPRLQSPAYPDLVALLMQTFRDKYNDPHLALSVFDYTRNLSIISYVFGCTTKAYNELLKTRWRCFRDLKGFHDALQEMTVNGVGINTQTRKLVEEVRRDVGEKTLWMEEDPLGDSTESWNLLNKIEELTAGKKKKSKVEKEPRWDEWKSSSMVDDVDDQWGFDKWDDLAGNKVP
ncbi:hypothetical protein EDD18DRAFT_710986 [Armillaria luteobubalina]|uniref:Mtf2-like C-terminal domain-containing protein n=1 Tax=Armillaria luteobubalina TaxID=153913 RepID=A0AA39UIS5_9AGAR|nr:hypothetical protein EDD18DRAFT_390756 [Armillaria luteobubalina]KAK0484409.1 hypothetical protein EDD18DRAFT_710986 [Armillaria luteobubalina]